MKYKLIFSDFDGTLEHNNEVSEENAKAVREYVKRGGIFVVCTGRMSLSVPKKVIAQLGIENQRISVVGFQGSHIQANDGEVLYSTGISHDVATKIVQKADELGLYHHFYDFDHVYVKERNWITNEYERLTNAPITVVGNLLEKLRTSPELIIPKMLYVVSPEQMNNVIQEVEKANFSDVEYAMSHKTFLEFVPTSSGKGNALKRVAKMLGVDLKDTIAIGDNQNDLSMIQTAGLGVAVGNAHTCLKENADYITVTNDMHAIKAVIERFCLGE